MLGVVDRLFQGDEVSIVSELVQNARRAGAKSVTVTRSVLPDGGRRVEVVDDGTGVEDPQILLGLRDSAWADASVVDEDPAGMGFFVLSGCSRSGVASRDWVMDDLGPAVFLGKEQATVRYGGNPIIGTRVWFDSRTPASPYDDGRLRRFLSLCGMTATMDGRQVEPTDFIRHERSYPDSVIECGEFKDLGVKYSILARMKESQIAASATFNFLGFEGSLNVYGILGAQLYSPAFARCSIRVDIEHAKHIKPVLPARKALVVNEALRELLNRLNKLSFETVGRQPHFLSFDDYQYAQSIGASFPEAARSLVPVDLNPDDYNYRSFVANHGKGVAAASHAVVEFPDCGKDETRTPYLLANAVEGHLRWETDAMPISLVWSRRVYKGYSWYDALPTCHVFQSVDGKLLAAEYDEDAEDLDTASNPRCCALQMLKNAGYAVADPDDELPEVGITTAVAIVVDPAGRHTIAEVDIPAAELDDASRDECFSVVATKVCVSSSADVEDAVDWITTAFKPEDFEDDDDHTYSNEWDQECLAAVRLRLQTPHDARSDVFRRFYHGAADELRRSSVSGLAINNCAVRLSRGHGYGSAWSCRWRIAGALETQMTAGPRKIVVERTVVERTVVDVPASATLADAMVSAKKRVSVADGVLWEREELDVMAFEEGTTWTEI